MSGKRPVAWNKPRSDGRPACRELTARESPVAETLVYDIELEMSTTATPSPADSDTPVRDSSSAINSVIVLKRSTRFFSELECKIHGPRTTKKIRDDKLADRPMVDWNTLIEEHGPLVLRISWRILGNRADVEDNVQEVFLQAVRLQGREEVRHWRGLLRRLATLGALGSIRRRRGHLPLEDVSPVDPRERPDESAMRRELQRRLRLALAELPDREGAVFSLRYFEGMTLAEIAESLEISYAAAGTALSRARSKLDRALCPTTTEDQ